MIKQKDYSDEALLHVLKYLHPELVKEAVAKCEPRLTDLSLIPAISSMFNLDNHDSKLHFIACVLKLYDPAVFITDKALGRGIAPKIAEVLGCTRTNVSEHANTVRHFYQFNVDYQSVIDTKVEEVMSRNGTL